jgi:hypothetical protein
LEEEEGSAKTSESDAAALGFQPSDYLYDAYAIYATDPDFELVSKVRALLKSPEHAREINLCVDTIDYKIPGRHEQQGGADVIEDLARAFQRKSRALIIFYGPHTFSRRWVVTEIEWWLTDRPSSDPVYFAMTHGPIPDDPSKYIPPVFAHTGANFFQYDLRGFYQGKSFLGRRSRLIEKPREWKSVRSFDEEVARLAADLALGIERNTSSDATVVKSAAPEAQPADPPIPAQRPAAIEPVWTNGRLTIPKRAAKSDLTGRKLTAAFASLREELHALVDDISGEANIDRRFVSHLRKIAAQIPKKSPQQAEQFSLGHSAAILAGYAKTVDEEWPHFLAVRYHALMLHFDRTVQQSPLWREFVRNAAQETLTVEQVANASSLGSKVANALRSENVNDLVDPAIPEALEQLTLPIKTAGNKRIDVSERGESLLAYDVVESVNNTLKRIAEAVLETRIFFPCRARRRLNIARGRQRLFRERPKRL